jgi:putative salt-induced outer membrane protein YdiY
MKKLLCAAVLACCAIASHAGESASGRATFSAAYASGNAPSQRLYGDAETTAQDARRRWQLAGKVEQRSDTENGDTSAWRGGGNYDRFVQRERFVYGRASLEHDSAEDLRRRSTAGFGYGAELRFPGDTEVSARGGLDYVSEHRYLDADRDYPALGWGLKVLSKPLGARLELFHDQDGFRDLSGNSIVLRSKTGLRVPLSRALSGNVQINVDWESDPAPGRRSTDSTLLVGLNYAW